MNTRTTYLASKPHYEILDGLRGVAAVMVIIFHLFEAHAGGSHLTQIINHGYLAVDFFFMLSGFVIGYAYDDRWDGGGSYWVNAAEISNRGIDFSINANIFESSDFSWNTNFNGTYLKNDTVFEIPAILAGILTQIGLWSINLRIMGGKSNVPLLKTDTIFSNPSVGT